jgi:hypothetical protein
MNCRCGYDLVFDDAGVCPLCGSKHSRNSDYLEDLGDEALFDDPCADDGEDEWEGDE